MRYILKKYAIITASLFFLTQCIPAVRISGAWKEFLIASLFLSGFLMIVSPITNILMLPLNILTLNLSSWLLSIAIVFVWSKVTPHVQISSWNFPGISLGSVIVTQTTIPAWEVTIISAILLTLFRKTLEWLFHSYG